MISRIVLVSLYAGMTIERLFILLPRIGVREAEQIDQFFIPFAKVNNQKKIFTMLIAMIIPTMSAKTHTGTKYRVFLILTAPR